jgi:uncharacterized membrane protein SpoIIM required for sporulation
MFFLLLLIQTGILYMNEKELLKEIYDSLKNLAQHEKLQNVNPFHVFHNAQIYTAEYFLEIFEKHNYKPEETNEQS